MIPSRPSGSSDPGWEHGVAHDEKKKKVKCNYCGKIVSGGIYRLKQHLARISGEVTYCKKAPDEVYLKMKENLEGCHVIKKQRQLEHEEQASLDLYSTEDDEDEFTVLKNKNKQPSVAGSSLARFPPLRSSGFVDPGWEHGVAQDEWKKKVKCNYCDKVVSGGINRFKQHLARIPGEVAYCKLAPEGVYLQMKENMKWHRTGRRRRSEPKDLSTICTNVDHEDRGGNGELASNRSQEKQVICDRGMVTWTRTCKKRSRRMSPGSGLDMAEQHPKSNSRVINAEKGQAPVEHKLINRPRKDGKKYKEVMSAICKFFCQAGIPFVAADFTCFHKMLNSVREYGHGFRIPSSQLIASHLQEEVAAVRESLLEYRNSWMITGCTILADSWKDLRGRTLINFLASCPRGLYFVTSIDASDIIEDATNLFKLLDKIVEDVGEEYVVQVVTEASVSYKAAGEMLEEKRRHLFWTPCVAYAIDRMLEDFVRVKWVKECMEKGKAITKFIYNRNWLLHLMKNEFTSGREILRPALTKSASSFLTMQSLIEHRLALKKMIQSDKWLASQFSKLDEGKEVEKIVLNSAFWEKMLYIKKSVDPILKVLLKVDSKKGPSMPFLYNDLYRARLAVKEIYGDEIQKCTPFLSIVDNHLNSLINHSPFVASYFLNPAFRYQPDFLALPEIMRGLNECIVRLEPDTDRRICASMQIFDFVSAKADFGTELAISTRSELDPAAWWLQHGISCLELQRIAVRILSQTSSSFGSEHSWSIFDQIHYTRQNCIAQEKASDFIYTHNNLRLKDHQLLRTAERESFESAFFESLLGDWIIEMKKPALQEEEGILYNGIGLREKLDNHVNTKNNLGVDSRHEPTVQKILPDFQPLQSLPVVCDAPDTDLGFLDENLSVG